MSDIETLIYVDELIEEYLLFRGFMNTLNSFRNDKKNDKMKGLQVCSPFYLFDLREIMNAIVWNSKMSFHFN